MPADTITTTTRLVAALADMSPLARQKIRATLEDMSQEITWNYWTKVFQPLPEADAEKKACGCLMMDGYLKEHPPEFIFIEVGTGGHWVTVDPEDWESVLADFYEMVDDDREDAVDRVSNTANAYDQYVKHSKRPLVKRVGGVEVLRTPARRELVKLVDQAEAMHFAREEES